MRKFHAFPKFSGLQSGYTLIELAVVVVVAGLMVASFSSAYNLYLKTQAEKLTDDRISNVTQAMSTYLVAFGAYPCPARANATRTDPDYGISTQCDPTQNVDNGATTQPFPYPCSAAVGCTVSAPNTPHATGCSNGLCWQTSDRKVQTSGENPNIIAGGGGVAMTQPVPVNAPANLGAAVTVKFNGVNYSVNLPAISPLIRRGMVPFRTLGITEDQAYDGYRSRLVYAVTEALAVPGTYMESGGAIDVLDPVGITWFRAGKPLAGTLPAQAYDQHVLFRPPGIPGLDPNPPHNYITEAATGTSILVPTDGGAAHYVVFSAGPDRAGAYDRDGRQTVACGAAGLDIQNCITPPTANSATGIYVVGPPSTSHLADNSGFYKDATGATVNIADTHFDDHVKYFSETETPLWKVSSSTLIGQDIQDLINAGGAGNGKIGIGGPVDPTQPESVQVSGDVHTATKLVATTALRDVNRANTVNLPLNGNCGAQYATGLSNGSLVCASQTQVLCPPGQIMTGFTGSGSTAQVVCAQNVFCPAQAVNLCQAPTVAVSDNRVLPSSANGVTVDTLTVSGGQPNGAPPNALSGDSYHEVWQCNGGTWNRQSSSGVCGCTPQAPTGQSEPCYVYYGQSNPSTYNNNVGWTTQTTCNPAVTTNSPQNHAGCVCNNLVVPNVGPLTGCNPGYSGAGTQTTSTDTFTCSNPGGDGPGTWSNSSSTTGTCTCDPAYAWPASNTSRTIPCPAGYTGNLPQTNTWSCSGNVGSWNGWGPAMTNPPNPTYCTCTGGTNYNTVPCGAGQTGTKTVVQTFNCGASPPDWTAWSDYDTSQCGTLTYVWKPQGNADPNSYGTPLANQAYQSCSSQGATGDCSKANNGSYTYYLNSGCQCQ